MVKGGRRSGSAVCLCLFFSVSVEFLASWIVVLQTVILEENVQVFQDEKMLFFMIGVIMSHNSNSFFLVSRV